MMQKKKDTKTERDTCMLLQSQYKTKQIWIYVFNNNKQKVKASNAS